MLNGLTSAISGVGNAKKQAAKLASKSPLDFSKSPTAHMDAVNNPFSYGSVYYPEETSNLGDGHYVIFDILAHKNSKYKTDTFCLKYESKYKFVWTGLWFYLWILCYICWYDMMQFIQPLTGLSILKSKLLVI